jgi:hypothetical protein
MDKGTVKFYTRGGTDSEDVIFENINSPEDVERVYREASSMAESKHAEKYGQPQKTEQTIN